MDHLDRNVNIQRETWKGTKEGQTDLRTEEYKNRWAERKINWRTERKNRNTNRRIL